MALKQHIDLSERFSQQYLNSEDYLIPFIEEVMPIKAGMKILEIGAAEGGVLKPFCERECWCLGVDLSKSRIQTARKRMKEEIVAGRADFQAVDVYDPAFVEKWRGAFDLILLKDTIEHIPEQERFIPHLKTFIKPKGKIFFGFPPWRMPFGGHQQICNSKVLGLTPYYHLLPKGIYRWILEQAEEDPKTIQELMEIKDTGISLGRFEKIILKSGFKIVHRRLYLINPIYRFKFGMKPMKQSGVISAIPFFRDFMTTAGWYLVE